MIPMDRLDRGECTECHRLIAITWRGYLWDHNEQPKGGGALFANKRGITTCRGSGRRPVPVNGEQR